MKVKKELSPVELIREIIKSQNGCLFTSNLSKLGIPRTYLSTLLKSGEIQKISRGVYASPDSIVDEMASIQVRFKITIYSHETALYLLGLSDRTPLYYSVTVPSTYNATSLKSNGIKVYFIKRELFLLGAIKLKSPYGNDLRTLNLERSICDVIRNRNQMDIQFVNEALKKYIKHKERNIHQLYQYADAFRVQKLIRNTIEVLL
jgi:predicted transcriptional regulator of viral defense system